MCFMVCVHAYVRACVRACVSDNNVTLSVCL